MFTGYLKNPICCIHKTCAFNVHSSAILLGVGRVMSKIVKGPRKKQKFFQESVLPTPKSFSAGATDGKKSVNFKRIAVLNKLFMRNLTDLMASGDYANTLQKYNIEINRIQITPDFNLLNVFWLANVTESDEVIEKLLFRHAGGLRHELSQLRVMGVVPRINFVKDQKYAQLREVDVRLAKADFGEDYVPDKALTKLKTELQLHTTLDKHIKAKIEKLDKTSVEDIELDIPEMTHNVFGINHQDIMERVKKAVKKSKAPHRLKENDDEGESYKPDSLQSNVQPFTYGSARKQREAFQEFLVKRKLLKLKGYKEKNYKPGFEYLQEEWEAYTKQQEETKFNRYFEDLDLEDEDFVDDTDICDNEIKRDIK